MANIKANIEISWDLDDQAMVEVLVGKTMQDVAKRFKKELTAFIEDEIRDEERPPVNSFTYKVSIEVDGAVV